MDEIHLAGFPRNAGSGLSVAVAFNPKKKRSCVGTHLAIMSCYRDLATGVKSMPTACSVAIYAVAIATTLGCLVGAQADLCALMKATSVGGCYSVALQKD
jgi:hypothetical protein